MPLPVTDSRHSRDDLLRLFHQTEQRWTEHLAEPTLTDVGTAYCNPALGGVQDANNVRDAALPAGMTPAEAVRLVTEHYRQQGVRCAYWVMNPSASPDSTGPLIDHLLSLGYAPRHADVLLLGQSAVAGVSTEVPGLTIIPARAGFRQARVIAEETARAWGAPALAEAFMAHLEDPHWDALLALSDGVPVAYAGVLSVGQIGRIDDVFVSAAYRGRGVGRLMVGRVLEICARSQFRHVMLSTPCENAAAQALYRRFGVERIGQITSYTAP